MTRFSHRTLSIVTIAGFTAALLIACGTPSTYEGGGRGGTGSRSPNIVPPDNDPPDTGSPVVNPVVDSGGAGNG